MPTNYIRSKTLRERYVPVNITTIWRWVKEDKFPQPIRLNPGVVNSPVVWKESEILEWLASRPRGYGIEPKAVELRKTHIVFDMDVDMQSVKGGL